MTATADSTGVLRYLDISTGHVSEETMNWLDDTSAHR